MLATFQALAEPNRLRIVELLRRGPRAVGSIGEKLQLRQPQVSKHLSVLKAAGLVEMEARRILRLHAPERNWAVEEFARHVVLRHAAARPGRRAKRER